MSFPGKKNFKISGHWFSPNPTLVSDVASEVSWWPVGNSNLLVHPFNHPFARCLTHCCWYFPGYTHGNVITTCMCVCIDNYRDTAGSAVAEGHWGQTQWHHETWVQHSWAARDVYGHGSARWEPGTHFNLTNFVVLFHIICVRIIGCAIKGIQPQLIQCFK